MANVIYTAIIGNYDILQLPQWNSPNWHFICFTTEEIHSSNWQVIRLEKEKDQIRQARKIKIMPLQLDYKYSLWVDGNIQVIGNLDEFIEPMKTFDISLMSHPHRSNLQQECDAIIKYKKDEALIVRSQLMQYRIEKYNCNNLSATGILFRKNNSIVNKHAEIWLNEVMTKSHRDQMSFDYACWKTNVTAHKFPFSVIRSRYFNHTPHPHRQR